MPTGPTETVLRTATDWTVAGRWNEAGALLRAYLPVSAEEGRSALGWTLVGLVRTLNSQDFMQSPRHASEKASHLQAADGLAVEVGDELLQAAVLHERAVALHVRFFADGGEPDEEVRLFERAADIRRRRGDEAAAALSTFYLGCAHHVAMGRSEVALPLFKSVYSTARLNGDRMLLCQAVRHIGQIDEEQGRLDAAHAALTESLRLREQLDWQVGTASAHLALGTLQRMRGILPEALDHLRKARVLCERFEMAFVLRRVVDEYEKVAMAALEIGPSSTPTEVFDQINR